MPTKSTSDLLAERELTHGAFRDHARCTQHLKAVIDKELALRDHREQPFLTPQQSEALEMILHKIGRIVAGDPNFQDHWDDIAGYAKIACQNYDEPTERKMAQASQEQQENKPFKGKVMKAIEEPKEWSTELTEEELKDIPV